jgi:hypothetical protein
MQLEFTRHGEGPPHARQRDRVGAVRDLFLNAAQAMDGDAW